jgi:hypothetical protein
MRVSNALRRRRLATEIYDGIHDNVATQTSARIGAAAQSEIHRGLRSDRAPTADPARRMIVVATGIPGRKAPVHPHMLRHAAGYKLVNGAARARR